MVVNSGNWGFFLQKCLGGWRRGCGGATWKSMIGRADASSWTGACGPGPPVHRGPDQRGKSPFNLDRPCPSDGPSCLRAAGGGGRPTRGGTRRRAPARLAGAANIELPDTKSREKSSMRKRGRWGGSPGARRGWKSTGGDGSAAETTGGGALRRRCCGEGGEKGRGAGWRGGAASP
jgi:hypothetical protein